MPRRSSIVLLSIAAHAFTLSALVLVSIVAPGVLPIPHDVLAAPFERVIQLPEMPIPPTRQPAARPPRKDGAPVVAPDRMATIDPEPLPVERPGLSIEGDSGIAGDFSNIGTSLAGEPLLPAPPALPELRGPIRLHSGIDPPTKIADRRPVYPPLALQARVEGVVIVELTISEAGAVESAHVLRSIPALDQAALDAVRAWRFRPARLNGEPVAVVMAVTVNFWIQR